MKHIEQIDKVNHYLTDDHFEIIWSDNKVTVNQEEIVSGEISSMERDKDLLFIQMNSGEYSIVYDLVSKKKKKLDYAGKNLSEEVILIGKWNDSYTERVTSAIKWQNDSVLWQSKRGFSQSELIDEIFFSVEKGIIYKNELSSSNPYWQFDLQELSNYQNQSNEKCSYEVKHFLGILENKLIVQLSNATFLTLNLDNGELIEKINLNESHTLPSPVFYDEFKAHLSDNQLYWLSNQRLLKIDLKTFQITIIKDYFTEPRESQFRFMSNIYQNDKIYFVADYGWQYVTPSYVGMMGAESGEILWSEQLDNTGGLPEAPQVTKDRLYVRTAKGVLHIFERE